MILTATSRRRLLVDRQPAPLVHPDGGAKSLQRVLKKCEAVGAPQQRTPCTSTVSTTARAGQL